MKGYYFITDAAISRAGNAGDVRSALKAKVEVVQYREKCGSTRDMLEEALVLRRLCGKAVFLVNDRIDIALGAYADGVHLGRCDIPYSTARRLLGRKKIIGLTVHSLKQAKEAQGLGADYIGVSPVFATGTKPDAGTLVGVKLIKEIKKQVSIPVIAIGGISLSNAREVIEAGADGLCAISAVVGKPDVAAEIEKFQRLFAKTH